MLIVAGLWIVVYVIVGLGVVAVLISIRHAIQDLQREVWKAGGKQ